MYYTTNNNENQIQHKVEILKTIIEIEIKTFENTAAISIVTGKPKATKSE